MVRRWEEVLWPVRTPLIDALANRFLVKLWPFRLLALTNFIVARPRPRPAPSSPVRPSVSVVVPARNEAGNIAQIFARTPEMGAGTELDLRRGALEGRHLRGDRARDRTRTPSGTAGCFRQTGKGKGDAVRLGFAQATGDVLMILDADLTVPPEDLPRFYEAVRRRATAEFVNGVRLVYPMEERGDALLQPARATSSSAPAFSWLLGQPVKDTLCGTKVLWPRELRAHRGQPRVLRRLRSVRRLRPAVRRGAQAQPAIVDLPIRYRERTYGTTNIQRWSHGWLLLRMVVFAARRLKFV